MKSITLDPLISSLWLYFLPILIWFSKYLPKHVGFYHEILPTSCTDCAKSKKKYLEENLISLLL